MTTSAHNFRSLTDGLLGPDSLFHVLRALPDWIALLDLNQTILFSNEVGEQLFGRPVSQIQGENCKQLLFDLFNLYVEYPLESMLRSRKRVSMPLRVPGQDVRLWLTFDPVLDGDDNPIGALLIAHAIREAGQAEEALQKSEKQYAQLFATVTDAVMLIDTETERFLDVNDAALQLYGYTREHFIQMMSAEIVAEPDECTHSVWGLFAERSRGTSLKLHKKKDGELFPVEVSCSVLVSERGKLLCSIVRDVSERTKRENALEYHAAFQSVLADIRGVPKEEAEDAIWPVFLHSLVDNYSFALVWYGRLEGGVVRPAVSAGRDHPNLDTVCLAIDDHSDDQAPCALVRAISTRSAFGYSPLAGHAGFCTCNADHVTYGSNLALPLFVDGKAVEGGVLVYGRCPGAFTSELTDQLELLVKEVGQTIALQRKRKQAEQTLNDYQKQLRKLTLQMSRVEEQERRRISAGLHDSVVQNLALCRIKTDLIKKATAPETVTENLDELDEVLKRTIAHTRSLIFELSPPILYELGLVPAVKWLADRYNKQCHFNCEVLASQNLEALNEDLRSIIFQAVRELLVNVRKHAEASHVRVLIGREEEFVMVVVEDDGIGMPPDFTAATNGFGLFHIKESLRSLGGSLALSLRKTGGTRVKLHVPFEQQNQ
ncbi:PAS domain S-box protein [Oligoflexia bacterium]|nr:PAS domain S-box protein [Oligoflexia bacterium]